MKKALWAIAIATVVRVVQNAVQLHMLISEKDQRKRLNNELVDSLRQDNRTWLHDTMKGLDEIMQETGADKWKNRGDNYTVSPSLHLSRCEKCKFENYKPYEKPCTDCRVGHSMWEPKGENE